MKLNVPKLYSQRNSPWSPELLGYNTNPIYNIGGWGCLITSFGMYIDKTPHEVNEILKAGGGYAAGGGDFIWSKCGLIGLQQVYQSPFYSDPVTPQGLSKMRSLLDEGRPLLTHIDFDPRDVDDDMHWLLVYGYDDNDVFYAQDPWTGTQITLDVYGGATRCVYEWRAYDKILPKLTTIDFEGEFDKCRVDRDRNWNWFVAVCDALGVGANVDLAVNEAKKLVVNEDALIQKQRQLDEANAKISDLEGKVGRLTQEHNDFALRSTQTIQAQDAQIKELMADINELKAQITAPVYKGWKATLINLVKKLPF